MFFFFSLERLRLKESLSFFMLSAGGAGGDGVEHIEKSSRAFRQIPLRIKDGGGFCCHRRVGDLQRLDAGEAKQGHGGLRHNGSPESLGDKGKQDRRIRTFA